MVNIERLEIRRHSHLSREAAAGGYLYILPRRQPPEAAEQRSGELQNSHSRPQRGSREYNNREYVRQGKKSTRAILVKTRSAETQYGRKVSG